MMIRMICYSSKKIVYGIGYIDSVIYRFGCVVFAIKQKWDDRRWGRRKLYRSTEQNTTNDINTNTTNKRAAPATEKHRIILYQETSCETKTA